MMSLPRENITELPKCGSFSDLNETLGKSPSFLKLEQTDLKHKQSNQGMKKPLRRQQQQIAALQVQLEERTKLFQAVSTENQRLSQRLRVLEAVLPFREQTLTLLYKKTEMEKKAASYASGTKMNPMLMLQNGNSMGYPGSYPQQQNDFGWSSSQYLRPDSQQQQFGQQNGPGQSSNVINPSGINPNLCQALTKAQVEERAVSLWLSFVRQCSLHIVAFDTHSQSKFHVERLSEQISTFHKELNNLIVDRPQAWYDLLQCNLETGKVDPPPEEHWLAVANAVPISDEQVQDCKAALSFFKEKMGSILEERKQISTTMFDRLSKPHFTSITQVIRSDLQLQVETLTTQMRDNVLRERSMKSIIWDFLGLSVFTTYQTAKMYCISYPYILDSVAVLNAYVKTATAAAAAAAAAAFCCC
mmetsp:Transcript_26992/g.49674  ORF Transcript_26992/g.49674 Transcript_26992/m.49674 type:complete len:416 (-) Transcript_26992:1209-2456(-)